MEILIIFVIALGLAMDCFAIAISNSAISGKVKPGIPLKTAIAFAFSHLVMLFAGFWLGQAVGRWFEGIEQWVAIIIFLIIGSKMIIEARKRQPKTKVFDINAGRVIVVLSIATAMDAFLAGVALGITGMEVWLAALLVTISVFIFTLTGLAGGKNFGMAFAKNIAITGGIFILMAAASFLSQLFL